MMKMMIFQYPPLSPLPLIHQFWPHVQNRCVQCVSSSSCGHGIYAGSTAFAWRTVSRSGHTNTPHHAPHSYVFAAVTFFGRKCHPLDIIHKPVYVHGCVRHVYVTGHGWGKSKDSLGTLGKGTLAGFVHPYPHALRLSGESNALDAYSLSHSLHTWRVSI